MKYLFPRKRVILSIHKWLGIASAFFLVVLSITGLALNHTERLHLDDIEIRSKWLLNRYGMVSADSICSYKLNESFIVSQLGTSIFLNNQLIGEDQKVVGTHSHGFVIAVVTSNSLFMFTREGELIEGLETKQLEFDEFIGLGVSDNGSPVFITEMGLYIIDSDWINISKFEGHFTTKPLVSIELAGEQQQELLQTFQGESVSLYRVILDLHSGRLFGWGGRTLMDLTAFAILLLVSSGIGGWLRKSRTLKNLKKG